VLLRNILKIEIPQEYVEYGSALLIEMARIEQAIQCCYISELTFSQFETSVLFPELHGESYALDSFFQLVEIFW